MPKHVEMVRTKCQPKSWDGQNANHRKKSGQNANLWLALCPVGILSGWHFVHTPKKYHSQKSGTGRESIIDSHSSGIGIRGFHSWEWSGTGMGVERKSCMRRITLMLLLKTSAEADDGGLQ